MSMKIRFGNQRGRFQNGWLDSRHTFSFGEYFDSSQMGFSDLRVLNQDIVSGGAGFPMHRHRDMEIVSWVLQGRLRHEDSMGHISVVGPGGVQRLSAGSGMSHGEFNDSEELPIQFLQIWILPKKIGADAPKASYEAKEYSAKDLEAGWVCMAASDKAGATQIDQDASIYVTRLKKGAKRDFSLPASRRAWVHVALGAVDLNGQALGPGDGCALEAENSLKFTASEDSEIVVFDLR